MVKIGSIHFITDRSLQELIANVRSIERDQCLEDAEKAMSEIEAKHDRKRRLDNTVTENLLHDNAELKAKLGSKIRG